MISFNYNTIIDVKIINWIRCCNNVYQVLLCLLCYMSKYCITMEYTIITHCYILHEGSALTHCPLSEVAEFLKHNYQTHHTELYLRHLLQLPKDSTKENSIFLQVMAWCNQASHYLSQCWLSSMLPSANIRPQWVNQLGKSFIKEHNTLPLNWQFTCHLDIIRHDLRRKTAY